MSVGVVGENVQIRAGYDWLSGVDLLGGVHMGLFVLAEGRMAKHGKETVVLSRKAAKCNACKVMRNYIRLIVHIK